MGCRCAIAGSEGTSARITVPGGSLSRVARSLPVRVPQDKIGRSAIRLRVSSRLRAKYALAERVVRCPWCPRQDPCLGRRTSCPRTRRPPPHPQITISSCRETSKRLSWSLQAHSGRLDQAGQEDEPTVSNTVSAQGSPLAAGGPPQAQKPTSGRRGTAASSTTAPGNQLMSSR